MFAIIQTGGKQYRVENGSTITVERLPYEVGSSLQIGSSEIGTTHGMGSVLMGSVLVGSVLMVGEGEDIRIGSPTVSGATVKAKVVGHKRAAKVIISKKLRRQGKKLKKGHRQEQTVLNIEEISI